ncbi:sugar O-acyltransferase (sialic acid O-acetyltransferase NeuD family) [Nocardioides ginsengisegetis]|uniref:Sugar O-acyltransferase (Sialic acid O-acetyltransferase NeuD family) n=1 Tax=Nocardioides ginsengisegetis TaxID=661491 RepID=A0A7W3PAN2_9ACTN|nr:sugar O-acyltransferase (sialic acid O-acetyltransferase NeuD family) [Nocardioides ginsengisegetis]
MNAPPELVLVGASGLAREVLSVEHGRNEAGRVVVLDDDPLTWGAWVSGACVVGGLERLLSFEEAAVVVAVGSGAARSAIVRRLTAMGTGTVRYARVVHPDVDVPQSCSVGSGSIVLAGVVLTDSVTVGRHVVLMPNVTLTHDCRVADFGTISAGVALGGGVRVGHGARIGMNASVREGVSVGAGATLGMGSVLLEDLPAGETWVGVPARPMRARAGRRSA